MYSNMTVTKKYCCIIVNGKLLKKCLTMQKCKKNPASQVEAVKMVTEGNISHLVDLFTPG